MRLLRECRRLDAFLFPSCETNAIDPKMIYELCKINLNSMYKICKKLDKKLSVNALEYYCKLLRKSVFKFTYLSHDTLVL